MSPATPFKWIYKLTRLLIVSGLLLLLLIPAVAYVGLTLPAVQEKVRDIATQELTKLLGAEVEIDEVLLSPFNRVTLKKVAVVTSPGDTALTVQRLGAGINLSNLVFQRRIVINYTEIIGLEGHLWRDSAAAPLNIQPIIDALSPKEKNKPPTKFDLRINTVLIRKSSLTYDIRDRERKESGFDPSHVAISSLRADLRIPRLKNDDFHFDLRRLAFKEQSGFHLDNFGADIAVSAVGLTVKDFTIELPESKIGLSDIALEYDSWDCLKHNWADLPIDLSTTTDSYVTLSDFSAFAPVLGEFPTRASLNLSVSGTPDSLRLNDASIVNTEDDWWLNIENASLLHAVTSPSELNADVQRVRVGINRHEIDWITDNITGIPPVVESMMHNSGSIALTATGACTRNKGNADLTLSLAQGDIDISANYIISNRVKVVSASVGTEDLDLAGLFAGQSAALAQLGHTSLEAETEITLNDKSIEAMTASLIIGSIEYKGHEYHDITAGLEKSGDDVVARLVLDNQAVRLMIAGDANLSESTPALNFIVDARDVNLAALNLSSAHPDHNLSLTGHAKISGRDINHITGDIRFSDISFVNPNDEGVKIKELTLEAECDSTSSLITLTSDIIDGNLHGNFHWQSLPKMLNNMASAIFPSLVASKELTVDKPEDYNDFTFHLTLKDTEPLTHLVKMPVEVIYNVGVNGIIDQRRGMARVTVDAPYLKQKDKLIENTLLNLSIDDRAAMTFTTTLPTKNGKMALDVNAFGRNDHLDTGLEWEVERERAFKGLLSVSADFTRERDEDDKLNYTSPIETLVTLNPSEVVFNDTVWEVDRSTFDITPGLIKVEGFNVGHDNQFVTLQGVASTQPTDSLTLKLSNVNLDYIFETLNINNAMFGGVATGTFFASAVLSPDPHLYTPKLHVDGLKYNFSLMGDADIVSRWDTDHKAVEIKADVSQPNGCHSYIDGRIMPMADSLDFHFDADKIQVGFLKPFMAAFADDIDGYASGKARLWGSFKFIDMVGDIYADNVSLQLGFTGTTYWASDSIHLAPGRISLDNITLRDVYGHTGTLNGWVTHKCFKEPKFNFSITNLHEVLAYDVKENIEHPWYGRIFANGSATVNGVPGLIEIGVNMSTAPNSTFTFVLTDTEQANDYTFITFRDRDKAKKDSIRMADPTPEIVRQLRDRIAHMTTDVPSVYKMDFQVEVNPQALVNLVMDPVGGDRITARGSGNLRLTYDSANEDVRMFGNYTLTQGSYNFTLQDIIIKDFTIQDGSSISFQGDPYNAQLDIRAYYALNANLSDLDESFLQDKELNRTNVPVHAIMIVKGDMRQPDIAFDLDFPTLTQDTYRKVRSIVSTEEMMNRQIIYLLALNRFYTPDYMSATRGNELVSVASSTLSSQLGNILGQLSDKWSIAPNVRSDRGDFSDVEVDLALSSHLLNNRLLLNGNFGYRDKSLNTNTFVGDFDIEYLLNRAGTFRLKAYNRYNDQNYYLRSALTTQGVGIEVRRDFDSMTSFLRPLRQKLFGGKSADTKQDTVPATVPHKAHATTPSEFKFNLPSVESDTLQGDSRH